MSKKDQQYSEAHEFLKLMQEKKLNVKNSDFEKSKKNSSIKKIISIFMIVIFSASLISFFLIGLILPDKSFSESENRKLSSFPKITLSNVLSGHFMSSFETYMSDQFAGREFFVSSKKFLSRVLGNTEINGVYIGKNNRLFKVPSIFSEVEIKEKMESINSFSEKCNIKNQYFMLIPNSSEILKDDLPHFLSCPSQKEQIDKIYSSLGENIKTIDILNNFLNYDNKEDLYFKTDHHWTGTAAYIALKPFSEAVGFLYNDSNYQNVILSNSFNGTLSSFSGISEIADTINAYIPVDCTGSYYMLNKETMNKSPSVFDLEKLNNSNQYEVFLGGNFSEIEIHTKNTSKGNLLIFKDSYANTFIPLLTPFFNKIVIIDPRYYTDDITTCITNNNFSDLLFLYNVNTFLEDKTLKDVIG